MTVSAETPAAWRVLAIYGKSASTNAMPQVNIAHAPGPGLQYEVLNLQTPTLTRIQAAVNEFKPNVIYIWAGPTATAELTTAPLANLVLEGQDELLPEDLPELVAGQGIHALVLNMLSEGIPTTEIRQHVPFLSRWSPVHEVTALNAAAFANTLFSLLANSCATFPEAFAMANHILRAYACADTGAKRDPFFPILDSVEPPELPGSKPHPVPQLEGVDLSLGFSRSVPGWEDTRLLAPVAECNLMLTSTACVLDTERLAALGLALRALCCLEVRRTKVREVHSMNYSPQHIVAGTSVAAVVAETVSGSSFPLVLGVPAQVLTNQGLLEAALQATLTCDAISLRFQLPPHGSAPPPPSAEPTVAHNTKCTPTLITTSVWVVNLLRSIAGNVPSRLLPALGIGMVGSLPVAGFTPDCAKLFTLLQTQQPLLGHIPQITYSRFNQASGPPSALWDMNADVPFHKPEKARGKSDRGAQRETKFDELTANAAPVEQWQSDRPPLPQCTPQAFMNDLINFLTTRFGWTIHAAEFPNSVLNGNPLDLFNLYRAVVDRGGFKMGNAINWKGEVFTKMANWTADHKMTGVGNALKRHYRKLLWEYERANQRDIAGDRCHLCQGTATEAGTDWVACGMCQRWQHINCDPRTHLGKYSEYAEGGKAFQCVDCSKIKADPASAGGPPGGAPVAAVPVGTVAGATQAAGMGAMTAGGGYAHQQSPGDMQGVQPGVQQQAVAGTSGGGVNAMGGAAAPGGAVSIAQFTGGAAASLMPPGHSPGMQQGQAAAQQQQQQFAQQPAAPAQPFAQQAGGMQGAMGGMQQQAPQRVQMQPGMMPGQQFQQQ